MFFFSFLGSILFYLKREKEEEIKKYELEKADYLAKIKVELTKLEEKHEKNKSEIIKMLEKNAKSQEGKIKELEKKLRTFYY